MPIFVEQALRKPVPTAGKMCTRERRTRAVRHCLCSTRTKSQGDKRQHEKKGWSVVERANTQVQAAGQYTGAKRHFSRHNLHTNSTQTLRTDGDLKRSVRLRDHGDCTERGEQLLEGSNITAGKSSPSTTSGLILNGCRSRYEKDSVRPNICACSAPHFVNWIPSVFRYKIFKQN